MADAVQHPGLLFSLMENLIGNLLREQDSEQVREFQK